MRTFCSFFSLFFLVFPVFGQANLNTSPDTLLFQAFEGILDPADTMLTSPSGNDIHWVNYDQDNKVAKCVKDPGITPKGWYWESDLGVPSTEISDNDAFTSCSFLSSASFRNRNWLITSPVYIPDDTYWLCWRSLTYYGPDIMDGYQVLASTGDNFPGSFTDTLFSAASTKTSPGTGSLELSDYTFHKGYIHADGYTDSSYFFIDYEMGLPFYHGKLQPHSVSLAGYAGQQVYLAFLHDTRNAYQLQIDDILVTNQVSSVSALSNFIYFNVMPNPVHDFAFLNWKTEVPQEGRLSVVDQTGKVVFKQAFNSRSEGQIYLDAQTFASGIYYCKLETPQGQATKLLVKI